MEMENQQLPAETSERNANGTFGKGNQAFRTRKSQKGWQPYGERVQKWMGYSITELRNLYENGDELGKMSAVDMMAIQHVMNSLTGEDVRRERRDLLDRIEGMPVQTIKTGTIEPIDQEEIDELGDDRAADVYKTVVKE